jgi:TonB family protein
VARAGQGLGAPALRRLGLALAASLAAHAALLGALPRGWQPAAAFWASGPARLPLEVSFLAERAPAAVPVPAPAAPGTPLAPRYYAAHELDQRPLIMTHVEPRFPVLALAPTGRVVLQLYVDETGRVEKVAVESDDPNGAFAQSAREAFAGARYFPGKKGGVSVKALLRIEVNFGQ